MNKVTKTYFLAANSCEGFVSSFGDNYDPFQNWRAFIIKGGAGTGKSSFMKSLLEKAQAKNIEAVICPCSSDPDSLDAVIFPSIKAIIMDGTSPHTVEPRYPGACEEIINLGAFWNSIELYANAHKIIETTNQNKGLHQAASRLFLAAGQFLKDNYFIGLSCLNKEKALHFADYLCKKHIPLKEGKGYEWVRYLGSVTPKGIISFSKTALAETKNTVIFDDPCGAVVNIIMQKLRQILLESGYEIITIKNCYLPSLIIDGIIIPELSLTFLRQNDFTDFENTERKIHFKRFINESCFETYKKRIKQNKKIFFEITKEGCALLNDAKSVHDQLESYYIKNMDFDAVKLACEELSVKLFGN